MRQDDERNMRFIWTRNAWSCRSRAASWNWVSGHLGAIVSSAACHVSAGDLAGYGLVALPRHGTEVRRSAILA